MEIISKLITLEEIEILREPLEKLHQHHNNKSIHFSGYYPRTSFDARVEQYRKNANYGEYHIELFTDAETNNIVGFCIAYSKGSSGKVEVLFVDEKYRSQGLGAKLMHNAMAWFASYNIFEVELTVVYGNDAISFYEKLGFYPRSTIMTTKIENATQEDDKI